MIETCLQTADPAATADALHVNQYIDTRDFDGDGVMDAATARAVVSDGHGNAVVAEDYDMDGVADCVFAAGEETDAAGNTYVTYDYDFDGIADDACIATAEDNGQGGTHVEQVCALQHLRSWLPLAWLYCE